MGIKQINPKQLTKVFVPHSDTKNLKVANSLVARMGLQGVLAATCKLVGFTGTVEMLE